MSLLPKGQINIFNDEKKKEKRKSRIQIATQLLVSISEIIMSTLLLFFLTLSQAITAAATWSKSATVPFHQNPVQQLPLHAAHSNEQSLILTPSSSSKSTAVPGASGKNNGEIPGGSPLRFCDESRDTDLYSVDYIELHPFPLYM